MGGDCEGVGEDGSNGVVTWDDLYGSSSVGATILQWDLGGDKSSAKVPGGVIIPGSQADQGNDGNMWGGQGVGISPGDGDTGNRGATPHNIVH